MKRNKIKNNKKFLIVCSILIIVIIFIITIFINVIIQKNDSKISKAYEESNMKAPKKKIVDINKYNSQNNIDEKIQNAYFKEVENLLLSTNIDSLFSKMNKEFLEKYGINESNFKDYVLKNEYVGNFPAVTSMNYSIQRDGSYVYRLNCYRDDRSKYYVNLIENKIFDYTIDFSQDLIPTQDNTLYMDYNKNYDLEFDIRELERTENSISYELKITNNGEKEIEFFLNNITDMALKIENEDGTKVDGYVKQASSELSSRRYKINKNSYFIKKLYFPLDMRYHSRVKGMIFYDVKIEDISEDISITF